MGNGKADILVQPKDPCEPVPDQLPSVLAGKCPECVILGEWREAERVLAGETPGSTGWETARADVERLRDEYRRAFEAGLQNR